MSNSGIEQRLDKLLEKVSGGITGGHVSPPQDGREVARVVKRTQVATMSQKKNLVKYIVIGIAIILLLVGIIYFVAKTKYGKSIRDMMGSWLPGGNKKRKAATTDLSRGDHPQSKLVAQDVDFRSKPPHGRVVVDPGPRGPHQGNRPHGHGPQRPTVTVRVPRIPPPNPEEEDDDEFDPGAVKFRRRKGPVGHRRPQRPTGPPPPVDDLPLDDSAFAQRSGRPRGPSPPIDDTGPPAPPELLDASNYKND